MEVEFWDQEGQRAETLPGHRTCDKMGDTECFLFLVDACVHEERRGSGRGREREGQVGVACWKRCNSPIQERPSSLLSRRLGAGFMAGSQNR